MKLRQDAKVIYEKAIADVLPDAAVEKALMGFDKGKGKVYLVAIGKAAWQMANAANRIVGRFIEDGIIITKYGHALEPIWGLRSFEAGHPILDENTVSSTKKVLEMVENLTEEDTVLFLVSGGGSALFELPVVSLDELQRINNQLLDCGASIEEINTIRKRLSKVKGGRFAKVCYPAKVLSIVLSDVLGDKLDVIASGPAYPDSSTCQDALDIIEKYGLILSKKAMEAMKEETPKKLDDVKTVITGSVKVLCESAIKTAKELGYETIFLTDKLDCQAKEAGKSLGQMVKDYAGKRVCLIEGGETVVKVKGYGKGGRNQELALAAAEEIAGVNAIVCSIGSDGTDGPTDAAGGIVDGSTIERMKEVGIDPEKVLANNDAYNGLKEVDGLIFTGPTGTNVNDLTFALIE